MDCSVQPCSSFPHLLLVASTDFFYPLVEDPHMMSDGSQPARRIQPLPTLS
jgi:hypothetical protein